MKFKRTIRISILIIAILFSKSDELFLNPATVILHLNAPEQIKVINISNKLKRDTRSFMQTTLFKFSQFYFISSLADLYNYQNRFFALPLCNHCL